MTNRRIWFDRVFSLGFPTEAFPDILERLRGTAPRLEDRVRGLDAAALTDQRGGSWSIQENVGHLLDLEPLWAGRLDDLLAAEDGLRPADLENNRTHQANHNANVMGELLGRFRGERGDFVARLEALSEDDLKRTALHPRLQEPMTAVDLAFFVAEHDDHHLARITEILRR